jgi:hypothetical protein
MDDNAKIPSASLPLRAELAYDIPALFAQRISRESYPTLSKETKTYNYSMRDDAIKYITSVSEKRRIVDLALTVKRMDQSYVIPKFNLEESATSQRSFGDELFFVLRRSP